MKKSKKRNYAIIVLVVLLLALAVGYAAFSSSLTINGTATGTATWNVKFTDAKLLTSTGAVADSEKYGTVTFTDTTVTATGIKLSYPGDAVNLRVTITNAGTLPAELTGYTVTETAGGSADVIITPAVASGTTGEVIDKNGTCTQDFVIKWKADSEATSVTKSFTVTFNYTQKTDEVNITPSHTDA